MDRFSILVEAGFLGVVSFLIAVAATACFGVAGWIVAWAWYMTFGLITGST